MDFTYQSTSGFLGFLFFCWLVVAAVVHVAFALAVLRDAGGLRRGPELAPPGVWAAATLLAGAPVAALYWAVHHSTLRRETAPAARRGAPPASPEPSGTD